ncbi:MAG: hypothetical protein HC846_07990 [Blastocatellia bacterium]|nr:hypothetical protein [Blastocatellia bacterium]
MKKILLSMFIILGLVGIFKAFEASNLAAIYSDLTSTTVIEANQSFVLGEGKHAGYKAKIVNKGKVDIEIFTEAEKEERKSVGVLKPNDKADFKILKNTKVIFKNLGNETATIGIKLSGDTGLSMGYKPNKQQNEK